MDDIICSRAWHDDDHEGPDGWRIEHLWAYDDGTYSVCDSDGDHEPFEPQEGETIDIALETYVREAEESWVRYAKDCAETGQDPLGRFMVRLTIEKKENWLVWFTDWIGREKYGYAVIDGRRAGKIYSPEQLPKDLADYLCLKKIGDRYCMEGATLENIRNSVGYLSAHGPKYYMKFKLTYQTNRSRAAIAKDVRKAALVRGGWK